MSEVIPVTQSAQAVANAVAKVNEFAGRNMQSAKGTENLGGANVTTFDDPNNPYFYNILNKYPWTASNITNRDDIPYIILKEQRNTESTITRMLKFYGGGAISAAGTFAATSVNNATITGKLDVYEDIFPNSPTGNQYMFPYFTKSYIELQTADWKQLDGLGEAIKGITGGMSNLAGSLGAKNLAGALGAVSPIMDTIEGMATFALATQSPLVGIVDRPKIFAEHSARSVTIEFPLFNTFKELDFKTNLDFINVFHSQNLFIKRDYITGIPPCFYTVLVPGQYFSFASFVSDFSVENLGNVRQMYGLNIPDAYQIKITLRELLMPSLNQFQALFGEGEAYNKVKSTVDKSGLRAGETIQGLATSLTDVVEKVFTPNGTPKGPNQP